MQTFKACTFITPEAAHFDPSQNLSFTPSKNVYTRSSTVIGSLRDATVPGNTQTGSARGTKQAGTAQSVSKAAEADKRVGLGEYCRVSADVPLIAVEKAGSGARVGAGETVVGGEGVGHFSIGQEQLEQV